MAMAWLEPISIGYSLYKSRGTLPIPAIFVVITFQPIFTWTKFKVGRRIRCLSEQQGQSLARETTDLTPTERSIAK